MRILQLLIVPLNFVFGVAIGGYALADSFTPGDNLSRPRARHNVTELLDGRLLVTSGLQSSASSSSGGGCAIGLGPMPDADIYDPAADLVTSLPAMSSARWAHEQALMNDGRVLIVGGATNCAGFATRSAEIFDPNLGTFLPTDSMAQRRVDFASAKNSGGIIFVFGGFSDRYGQSVTSVVEKFDPISSTWSAAGYLNFAKGGIGACDLGDGAVLIFGGVAENFDTSSIYSHGAEIYHFSSQTTEPLGAITNYRHLVNNRAVRLNDGRCLIGSVDFLPRIELFDPISKSFFKCHNPNRNSVHFES